MIPFEDRMLLKFLEDDFVEDLLKNEFGLQTLFDLIYEAQDIEIKTIESMSVRSRQFQRPAFETTRVTGTEEHLRQPLQRVKVDYSRPRSGRLEWIDVFLEISLSAKIHDKQAPIERITTKNLLTKIGGASSMADLKNKLKALYPDSIVDAFFKKFRISTLEEFKRRGNLFVEFVYKAPPQYDPDDPQNIRSFSANVCLRLQSELAILESLRNAKLCRSILENRQNSAENFEGGQINTPYAFAVVFPDDVVADDSVPGLNPQEAKAAIKDLFASERMIAHFYKEP